MDQLKMFKDVLLSRSGKYAYTMVPKAGNTTVKHSLWASECSVWGFEPHCGNELRFGLHLLPEAPYAPLGAVGWEAVEAAPDAFVFTVVRNPFSRALSGFLDKGERLGCATFAEHLRRLAEMDPLETDHHFAPQWSVVWPDVLRYDAILALEGFPDTLHGALRSIFGAGYVYASRRHSVKTCFRLCDHYGPEETDLVRQVFKKDFELFGYSDSLDDVAVAPVVEPGAGRMTLRELLASARPGSSGASGR